MNLLIMLVKMNTGFVQVQTHKSPATRGVSQM